MSVRFSLLPLPMATSFPGFSLEDWEGRGKTLASAGHVPIINNSKTANLCIPAGQVNLFSYWLQVVEI